MQRDDYPFQPDGEVVPSVTLADCEQVAFREEHEQGKGLFAILRGMRRHGEVVTVDEYTLADNMGPALTLEVVVIPVDQLADGDEVTVHEKMFDHKGAIVAGAIIGSVAVVTAGTIKVIRSRRS